MQESVSHDSVIQQWRGSYQTTHLAAELLMQPLQPPSSLTDRFHRSDASAYSSINRPNYSSQSRPQFIIIVTHAHQIFIGNRCSQRPIRHQQCRSCYCRLQD